MPLHPDIARLLSPMVANSIFEITSMMESLWAGRNALAADDRPEKHWGILEIEAELKAAQKDGEVAECPGGWLLVPVSQRPKPTSQRMMFGD